MRVYYELLDDGTIGRSTPSEKVAASLGLTLYTDKREIVYGYDGKRYFSDEVPSKPEKMIIQERIDELKAWLSSTDYKVRQYIDGDLTEEQYKAFREKANAYRKEIRELEERIKNL